MSGEASRDALVAALASFPDELEGAARSAAGRPAAAGEWGAEEVVRHLIAVEREVHQARLRDLELEGDPRWQWAEPGPWDGEPELGLDGVLARFAAARADTVASLGSLDEAGWVRAGHHSTFGRLDVAGLVRNTVDHDQHHLEGLRRGPSAES